ncbi:MAG TPA: carboxymuconolactone decarboxylase family protein [Nocardioidaceae bacterium]|nr:carboxymuconolactone decarboxylase family protein [Nocardioidaceae bacterium]
MARISYVDPDSINDPELRSYLDASLEHGTPRLESQAIRAHVPELLRTFNQTWQATFRDGVLDHSVKELARVFIAKTLECGYCAGQRSHQADLSEREFDEVIEFRKSTVLSDREKAALLLAEAIAWDPTMADDAVWQQLHEHFTEPEIVELGYFIGLTMGQQKFLKTLDIKHGDLDRSSTTGLTEEAAEHVRAARSTS